MQRQRAKRRLTAWQKAGLVTRCDNVVIITDSSPKASIDVAAYVAAIALAGAAAFFSIKGMVVLFPGASLVVVVMSFAMERGQACDRRMARPAMAGDGRCCRRSRFVFELGYFSKSGSSLLTM
jgi:hypothetical protein